MRTTRVFVYGSLKRGFRHHDELRGARFCEAARTAAGYGLVELDGYPALVLWEPRGNAPERQGREGGARPGAAHAPGGVVGELYEVSAELLGELDAFEEVPTLYQRAAVELSTGGWAQAYVISPARAATLPRIGGGEWREPPGPSSGEAESRGAGSGGAEST